MENKNEKYNFLLSKDGLSDYISKKIGKNIIGNVLSLDFCNSVDDILLNANYEKRKLEMQMKALDSKLKLIQKVLDFKFDYNESI